MRRDVKRTWQDDESSDGSDAAAADGVQAVGATQDLLARNSDSGSGCGWRKAGRCAELRLQLPLARPCQSGETTCAGPVLAPERKRSVTHNREPFYLGSRYFLLYYIYK